MHPDEIRKLKARSPFEPFVIELTTGERVNVRHGECVLVPPAGHLVMVVDDHTDWINLDNISAVVITPKPKDQMSIEDLKAIRIDWRPVKLHLADGRSLKITNADSILFSPEGSCTEVVFVFPEPPQKGYQIVDPKSLVSIERE